MANETMKEFIEKYAAGSYTEEEYESFMNWLKTAPIEEAESLITWYQDTTPKDAQRTMHQELVNWIEATLDQYGTSFTPPAPVHRMFWGRVAAAASVLLAVALGGHWIFSYQKHKPEKIVQAQPIPHDVKPPETNRAMITLSNGNIIYLDSASNGTLARAAGANIVKLADGQLAYKADNNSQGPEYNTLYNPRGSKILDLTLSDGTKVWLNSGTSMRFPINFTGSERRVEVTGEAYFEVAKNPSKHFRVVTNKMEIEVLGTRFNVNAYPDEGSTKTTLLEGSVRLIGDNSSVQIKPGQQARFSGSFMIDPDVDVDKVMAWKNGMFEFDNVELPVIMRQISRWYNVDITYEKAPGSEKYGGGVGMQVPLSNVLKMLETNGIQCGMKGTTVVVKP